AAKEFLKRGIHVICDKPLTSNLADIAGRAADAGLCRISAPGGLLLAGLLDRLRQPVLRIFGLDDADVAEFAVRDHL
ncbi:hypothetical protein AB9F41_38855, partial [Rhizobium leguminosarum]|uniref:hypothetical protein n=1 Tax=Rhizobium leguminosarum TaxID=384 RepID=UPI003F95D5FA